MATKVDPCDKTCCSVIGSSDHELKSLSQEIWRNPELKYEEHIAHRLLTDYLEEKRFTVERGYCDLPTAFRARFGNGQPNVCVICEYDALPNIGHACGHNLIAEAGIAAGLGIKAFIESNGIGMVTVMGTPAEEGGGGKVLMIERGGFNGIDVAIMAHPGPSNHVMCTSNARIVLDITYSGKAAHAAAFPWEGVNALDAGVLAYTNISALRQQMKPSWRVHGIFTNGGVKPNIIPETVSLQYYIRASTMEELCILKEKVISCFKGAATSTGCTVEISEPAPSYDNLVPNRVIAQLYSLHLESQGITDYTFEAEMNWSTDMGNVSQLIPSLHPNYSIGNVFNHNIEFTNVSNTDKAHGITITIGKTMAHTCIDIINGGVAKIEEINKEFKKKNN